MIEEIRQWTAKVEKIVKNGILLKEESSDKKHPFPEVISSKQSGKIKDPIIFTKERFKIDDIINIKISYIDPELIKEIKEKIIEKEGYVKWISIVYDTSTYGFFTKEYDPNEDRFKRLFTYQYRTHLTDTIYLNNSFKKNLNPFEVGDVISIELIKK